MGTRRGNQEVFLQVDLHRPRSDMEKTKAKLRLKKDRALRLQKESQSQRTLRVIR